MRMQRFLILLFLLFSHLVANSQSVSNDKQLLERAKLAVLYKNYGAALELLEPLAAKGNMEAMHQLSVYWAIVEPRENRNLEKSRNLLTILVNRKYPAALLQMASYLQYGNDEIQIEKDPDGAIAMLNEASILGSGSASFELAQIYGSDRYGLKNSEQAFFFANRGYEQGVNYAASRLASYYKDGVGTAKNLVKAYELYSFDCYSTFINCESMELLDKNLTVEQRHSSTLVVSELLQKRGYPNAMTPPEMLTDLASVDRSQLQTEYKRLSPLYAAYQLKVLERYYELGRSANVDSLMLQLETDGVVKGRWNTANPKWKETRARVSQNLVQFDRQRFQDLQAIAESTDSLNLLIDKHLTDEQLKFLVSLYRSEASARLQASINLTKKIELDGSQMFWKALAVSGMSMQGGDLSNHVGQLNLDYEKHLTNYKLQLETECFISLHEISSEVLRYGKQGMFSISFHRLPFMLTRHKVEALKYCVEGESWYVSSLLKLPPVKAEIEVLQKWKSSLEISKAYRSLEEKYKISIVGMLKAESSRLR
ncbi:MAG: hypothetical protein CFE44_01390 [Burkholderiales bacterium PBB4]|nr:MAG: hypothetical protein CFE44_01390 [Burkholderiales bacterium PBB4]